MSQINHIITHLLNYLENRTGLCKKNHIYRVTRTHILDFPFTYLDTNLPKKDVILLYMIYIILTNIESYMDIWYTTYNNGNGLINLLQKHKLMKPEHNFIFNNNICHFEKLKKNDDIDERLIGIPHLRYINCINLISYTIYIAPVPVPAPVPPVSKKSFTVYTSPSCVICYDNKSECIFNPCGHQCICTECNNLHYDGVDAQKKCPVCRVNIDSSLVIMYVS